MNHGNEDRNARRKLGGFERMAAFNSTTAAGMNTAIAALARSHGTVFDGSPRINLPPSIIASNTANNQHVKIADTPRNALLAGRRGFAHRTARPTAMQKNAV